MSGLYFYWPGHPAFGSSHTICGTRGTRIQPPFSSLSKLLVSFGGGAQGRSDTFVFIVLSVMPWAGRDLSTRDEANFVSLMAGIDTYLRFVDWLLHHAQLVWRAAAATHAFDHFAPHVCLVYQTQHVNMQ